MFYHKAQDKLIVGDLHCRNFLHYLKKGFLLLKNCKSNDYSTFLFSKVLPLSLLIPTEFLLKQTFNELALGRTIYQCVYYFPERKRYTLETSLANPEITLPVQNKAQE